MPDRLKVGARLAQLVSSPTDEHVVSVMAAIKPSNPLRLGHLAAIRISRHPLDSVCPYRRGPSMDPGAASKGGGGIDRVERFASVGVDGVSQGVSRPYAGRSGMENGQEGY